MSKKFSPIALSILVALVITFGSPAGSLAKDGRVCWELTNELKMPAGLEDLAENLSSFPKKVCINGLSVAGAVPDPEAKDTLYKAIKITGTLDGQAIETRAKSGSREGIFCSRVSKCRMTQLPDDSSRFQAVIDTKGYRFEAEDGTTRTLKADIIVSFNVGDGLEPTGTPTIRAEVYEELEGSQKAATPVATTFIRAAASAP